MEKQNEDRKPSPDSNDDDENSESSLAETEGGSKGPKKLRKFKKAPGAPKRFRSAFIFFSQHKHKEIQESLAREGGSKPTTKVAKMVSEEWRTMKNEERTKWEKMAQDDKKRFETEKATYRGPWTVPIGHRKSKDPSAPKRPASAFLAFSNTRRASVKRERPNSSNAEVSRTLSKMWKEAPESIRKKYTEEEAREREQYKLRIADWRQSNDQRKKARSGSVDASEPIREGEKLPLHHSSADGGKTGSQVPTSTSTTTPPATLSASAAMSHEGVRSSLGTASAPARQIQIDTTTNQLPKPSEVIRQSQRSVPGLPWASQAVGMPLTLGNSQLLAHPREGDDSILQHYIDAERRRMAGMAGVGALTGNDTLVGNHWLTQYEAEIMRSRVALNIRREDFMVNQSPLDRMGQASEMNLNISRLLGLSSVNYTPSNEEMLLMLANSGLRLPGGGIPNVSLQSLLLSQALTSPRIQANAPSVDPESAPGGVAPSSEHSSWREAEKDGS